MGKMEHHYFRDTSSFKTFFKKTTFRMVDVSQKQSTYRKAIAQGKIVVGSKIIDILSEKGTLPKGDLVTLSEISGIQGAKIAHTMIPLCHPLNLDQVIIHTEVMPETQSIIVYCMVSAFAKTGVEMEALAGVNASLLGIYDLSKQVQPVLNITDIRLLIKVGGKNNMWVHPDGLPHSMLQAMQLANEKPLKDLSAAVLTVSERASRNEYKDKSGVLLKQLLVNLGFNLIDYSVVPDQKNKISEHIIQLVDNKAPRIIITTGGTGLSPLDVTSDVVTSICDKLVPGIGELLRKDGAKYTKFAWLSSCLGGIRHRTLIICLPGNSFAVQEGMAVLGDLIPHALDVITEDVVV